MLDTPKRELRWLNSAHEYIALWLIANPGRNQSELAEELGYSETWISTVIHTDAFQAHYRLHTDAFQAHYRLLAEQYQTAAVETIGSKVQAATAEALDLVRARLRSQAASEKFLIETTKVLLTATGYGAPKVPSVVQHEHVHVDAATLIEARKRLNQKRSEEAGETQTIEIVQEEVA